MPTLHAERRQYPKMRAHVDAPEVYIKSDVAFHNALAEATQNELFVIVLDSLVEIMIEVRLLTLRVPGIARLALFYHERILDAVRAALRPDTALVAVHWANNETGVLQPVGELAASMADHQAWLHTDGAQAARFLNDVIAHLSNPGLLMIK